MGAHVKILVFLWKQLGIIHVSFDFSSPYQTAFLSSENPYFGPAEMGGEYDYSEAPSPPTSTSYIDAFSPVFAPIGFFLSDIVMQLRKGSIIFKKRYEKKRKKYDKKIEKCFVTSAETLFRKKIKKSVNNFEKSFRKEHRNFCRKKKSNKFSRPKKRIFFRKMVRTAVRDISKKNRFFLIFL